MDASEGKAVQLLEGLLDAALEGLGREKAEALLMAQPQSDMAAIARLLSAASVAQGMGGDLFMEVLAEHLCPTPKEAQS